MSLFLTCSSILYNDLFVDLLLLHVQSILRVSHLSQIAFHYFNNVCIAEYKTNMSGKKGKGKGASAEADGGAAEASGGGKGGTSIKVSEHIIYIFIRI